MGEVPIERRFRGSVRLVTLHLWRVGASTDLDACFRAARKYGMIDHAQEEFIRACLMANACLEAGEEPGMLITPDIVAELQADAIRLNSADPA